MATFERPLRFVVLFSGRVQGVGFRYATAKIAQAYPVSGYVRNLPDGRVELVGEGSKPDLDALVSAIQQEMSGYIRDTQISEQVGTGEFSNFRIQH